MSELPLYQCHKQVGALKVRGIVKVEVGFELHFEDDRFAPHPVPNQWVAHCEPHIGGYFVRYEDGYESFSPARVFEMGYTAIKPDTHRPAYQQRVVKEMIELDRRIDSLESCMRTHIIKDMSPQERSLVERELPVMKHLSELLHERVRTFPRG